MPGPPARFLVPETDPAGPAARAMWQRIPEFFNFRAHIPGAEWRVNTAQQFAVRPEAECLADLVRLGVPARRRPDLVTPVPSPVELLGPVDGVWFLSSHSERPILIACEMAARLPALVAVLKQHGVEGVEVLSAYREEPFTSFHTMGMALDINRLYRGRGLMPADADIAPYLASLHGNDFVLAAAVAAGSRSAAAALEATLVRAGNRMELTTLARRLQGPLKAALASIQATLDVPREFDPAKSPFHARLALSDYGGLLILPTLHRLLRKDAPGFTIEVLPKYKDDVLTRLPIGDIDLATAKVGIVLVNINPAYRAVELEYALMKVGCKALVMAPALKSLDPLEEVDHLSLIHI